MKVINFLFFFASIFCISQTKKEAKAIFIENIYRQTKILQDDKPVENDTPETISKYLYIINKNNVIFYDSTDLQAVSFVLKSSKNKNELLFQIKKIDESNLFKINFNDSKRTISINKDIFSFNANYYDFLKKTILQQKNILEFIDFLDDFLPEYSSDLQKLIYITPKTKYKNADFKIIKASITTKNEQADNLYNNWNVEYKYDKEKLVHVKMFSKNEVRFQKKLIAKTNSSFSYSFYKNIDERSSSDGIIKFNLYNSEYDDEGSYLQVGINKETFYKNYLKKKKEVGIEKPPSSAEEVKALFSKYLPE